MEPAGAIGGRFKNIRRSARIGARRRGAAVRTATAGKEPAGPGAHHTWMAIMLIVMIGGATEWVPGLLGLPLAKIAFFFTVLFAYRARHTLVPIRVASLPIARPALAFLVLTILSVSFSIYRSNTLVASVETFIYLLTFIVLVKITQTLRDVERMLLALAGCAASLAAGILLNYTGGRAHINHNFDPNDIAYALDTLLPIVIALGAAHARFGKWLAYGLAMTVVVAILLTGSRGGAIGLGMVVLGMTMWPLGFSKKGELRRFTPAVVVARLVVLALLGGVIWASLPQPTRERLATLEDLQHDYNADANVSQGRLELWRRDIRFALERPIGYGLDSAAAVDGRLGGGLYFTAHNSFVEAFLEMGALGLVLFTYTYYITFKELGKVTSRERPKLDPESANSALYARALRIALVGNVAAGFFLSHAYSACLWMLVGICASLVRIVTATPPVTDKATRAIETVRGAVRGGQLRI